MTSRTLLATAALAALLPLAAFADSGASALARTGVAGNGPGGGTRHDWNIEVPHGAYGYGQSGKAAGGSYINPTLYISREARNNFYVDYDGTLKVANDNYPTGWDDGVWTVSGSANDKTFVFTGSTRFQGASYTTKVDEAITMYCYNGAQCDSTASLALGLGTGITMTSESGAFLTASSPSAVPEPTNALLLLGGLGALALAARRRLAPDA